MTDMMDVDKLAEELHNFNAGLWYIRTHKFRVMPIHGAIVQSGMCTCGKIDCNLKGKHPCTMHGVKNATNNIYGLYSMFYGKTPYHNIAIAGGEESGVFIIDIDGPEGEVSIADLESKYGKLPKTLTCITANGRHLYYKYPKGKRVKSTAKKVARGIDIRGEGGYVVAPPSFHITGVQYMWENPHEKIADVSDWFLKLKYVCEEVEAKQVLYKRTEESVDDIGDRWTDAEIEDMLSYLDPTCKHDDWVAVGMALHDGGYSLHLWDEWSRGKDPLNVCFKYNVGACAGKWRTFKRDGGITMGTLVHMAQARGWKPLDHWEECDLMNHPARAFLINTGAIKITSDLTDDEFKKATEIKKTKTDVRSDILIEPLKLPGLIGDTVRAIVDVSPQPQPELAMLNVIAAAGALFGRRYGGQLFDTRTNMYAVGVASTGAGKDISRQQIKKIFTSAGLSQFLSSDTFRSEAGIIRELTEKPSCIMHLDEIGEIFKSISGDRAASHHRAVGHLLLSLYQSSNSEYRAGRYADKNAEEMVLNNPNLCIFGTTTEESYVSSMTREVITNGKLNRYIIIPSSCDLPDVPEYDLTKTYEISESVISGWREFAPSDIRSQNINANLLADLNSNSVLPPLIKVSYEQTLKRIHQIKVFEIDQCRKLKSSTGPLWARYQQNTLKIAMIFAIIRNKNSPVIIDQDLDIAEGIMMTSLRYATHLAENKMYENPFEKNVQDMLTKITSFGDEGVTKTELKKSVRSMQPRDFDNAVNHLIDSELIEVVRATGVGRPTVKYKAR